MDACNFYYKSLYKGEVAKRWNQSVSLREALKFPKPDFNDLCFQIGFTKQLGGLKYVSEVQVISQISMIIFYFYNNTLQVFEFTMAVGG
jgi:hypothetical protein